MAKISEKDKQYLLSLKPEDLTFELLVDMFGDKQKPRQGLEKIEIQKSKWNLTDTFKLTPREYFVKTEMETTVGKFIYNKYMIEYLGLEKVIGYVDWELTDSGNTKLEGMLSEALLNDKITVDTFKTYIDRRDVLGEQMHFVVTTSFTMGILKPQEKVNKQREELIEKNRDKLMNGDIAVAEEIEKKLIKTAKEELKDDPGMDLYNSEARGSFNNNYKNINIVRGPVYNNITGKYDFVESSLMDGIKKQDIPSYANAVVAGAYPKFGALIGNF